MEEWRFFHQLHCALGFEPEIPHPYAPGGPAIAPTAATTTDDVLAWMSHGARIPFDRVKASGAGQLYPDPPVVVEPKESGWSGRLEVGHPEMLRLLDAYAEEMRQPPRVVPGRPFRLVCRREGDAYNTSCNVAGADHGRFHNPAHIHPADLAELGVEDGGLIEIASDRGVIPAVVAGDETLRRGLVSMMFGFGGGAESDARVREVGSNPNRLIANDVAFDPYTGQPQMSNVPVSVRRLDARIPTA
jgi:anaerobic selenocysteine-containing dehydrogenase